MKISIPVAAVIALFLSVCASRDTRNPETKRAADIWHGACAFCHGENGTPPELWAAKGMRKFGTLGMKMGFFFGGDKMRAGIKRTIEYGKGTEMRAFKGHLSENEINALVKHIEDL